MRRGAADYHGGHRGSKPVWAFSLDMENPTRFIIWQNGHLHNVPLLRPTCSGNPRSGARRSMSGSLQSQPACAEADKCKPVAWTHSSAEIIAAWPMTSMRPRCPRLEPQDAKPFSALCKVMRSSSPARSSAAGPEGEGGAGSRRVWPSEQITQGLACPVGQPATDPVLLLVVQEYGSVETGREGWPDGHRSGRG